MTIERVVTPVIKAADVVMGPPVMVGTGSPILQQAEAVASAAWSKSEVPKAFHSALADVNLDPGLEPAVPNPAQQFFENNVRILSIMSIQVRRPQIVLPPVEPNIVPLPKPEVNTIIDPAQRAQPVPSTNPLPEQTPHQMVLGQAEQLTEETEIAAKPAVDQDKIRLTEQQQLEGERLINVEDWQVSQQRRFEISQAIKRVWVAVKEASIFGWMVSRFLPGQHEGNISQLVRKKGPDGSLVDTEQAIKNDPREFKSEQEAKEGLLSYVALFKPAKKAVKGEPLPKQHVARVLKFVKHIFAYEVFVQRIIKKRVQGAGPVNAQSVTSEKTKTKTEGSLADYPELSAVFND